MHYRCITFPLRAIHKVITPQLRKKLIMQGEVKIAVISKQVQHSPSVLQSPQTPNTQQFTTPLCMQLVNNASHFQLFTDTITILQRFCTGEKREAYSLTAG